MTSGEQQGQNTRNNSAERQPAKKEPFLRRIWEQIQGKPLSRNISK